MINFQNYRQNSTGNQAIPNMGLTDKYRYKELIMDCMHMSKYPTFWED